VDHDLYYEKLYVYAGTCLRYDLMTGMLQDAGAELTKTPLADLVKQKQLLLTTMQGREVLRIRHI